MPTGYTAKVATGEETSLRSFALNCARAMGALVMMRDEPLGAPIPERFEPSNTYAKWAQEAEEQIIDICSLTAEECEARSEEAYVAAVASRDRYIRERGEQRARYEAMIEKVVAWEGAPEGLKEFMLQQLTESIRHDCDTSYFDEPVKQTGVLWRSATLLDASQRLKSALQHDDEERTRTKERNAWITQLRASLEGIA